VRSELVIFNCEQGSPEWFEARRGVVTASCFPDVLAKGQGLTRGKLLRTLAGEVITGKVEEGYSNGHMERGQVMEAEARDYYAEVKGVDPVLVGFMKRGRIGCSPDSLIGEDGMLEIKTKMPHLQLEVLDKGVLPSSHVAQVQGQLLVSGRMWCDFVSYWPGLPIFITRVTRDTAYMANLQEELNRFIAEMDRYIERYGRKES
jgi:hypothetical protein